LNPYTIQPKLLLKVGEEFRPCELKPYGVQIIESSNLMEFKLFEQGGGIMNLIFGRLIVQQTFSHPS
jgi:hypothetical protein|tara:strand:+ start:154 stop:354 length:201 start_codon:yes stop_codon:yes gene_type:complete